MLVSVEVEHIIQFHQNFSELLFSYRLYLVAIFTYKSKNIAIDRNFFFGVKIITFLKLKLVSTGATAIKTVKQPPNQKMVLPKSPYIIFNVKITTFLKPRSVPIDATTFKTIK